MSIRNPSYLDQDLLQNIADYLGVGYPVEMKVRELGNHERSGSAGLGIPGVPAGVRGARSSSEEIETTYEAPVRPVKVLNDVLDAAIASNDVKRFGTGSDVPAVARRDLVEIEGSVALSAISEMSEMLDKFLPAMIQMPGVMGTDGPPAEVLAAIFTDDAAPRPLLMELTSPDLPLRVLIQLSRDWFHRNASPDDLGGDVAVFGIVEQLVPEGSQYGLDRFLMPGANRAMRRMIGKDQMAELMEKLGQNGDALTLEGPAWIVRPIAVF